MRKDSEWTVGSRNSFSIRSEMSLSITWNRKRGTETQTTDTKKYLKRRLFHCGFFGHQKKVVTLKVKKKVKRGRGVPFDSHEDIQVIFVQDGPSLSLDRNSGWCLQMGPWPFLETPL